MRLIDADAFDKCLEQVEIEATKSRKYVFSSAINTIRGNLANAPTIGPQKWIPVSERLPEDEQVVLVQDTEGSMWIWKYFSENLKYRSPYQWEDENGEWQLIDEVVAWMSLPEPWKEEEE